jgi:hypothetical protein
LLDVQVAQAPAQRVGCLTALVGEFAELADRSVYAFDL